jgi:transcription initiation factor TFIIIB Brf1 subunit/transcription initiation factor TFIIB
MEGHNASPHDRSIVEVTPSDSHAVSKKITELAHEIYGDSPTLLSTVHEYRSKWGGNACVRRRSVTVRATAFVYLAGRVLSNDSDEPDDYRVTQDTIASVADVSRSAISQTFQEFMRLYEIEQHPHIDTEPAQHGD